MNSIFNILKNIQINPINIYKKMSKTATKKAQTVYAWLGYGGVLKAGYSYITITTTHPETELDAMKKYYGDEFKGRWVKSTQSIESLTESMKEKLEEHKYSGNLYKISASEGVRNILKEVFGCTKCSTMGVYEDKEDKDEEEKEIKETKEVKETKKEVKEEAKPKDKKQSKAEPEDVKEVKKEKKQTAKAEPEEVKETKQAKESKESKKTKPEAEKKKVKKVDSDDEEEAPKKTKKSSTKTQIVLSDSDEDEEEDI